VKRFLMELWGLVLPAEPAIPLREAVLCANCEVISTAMGASQCPICESRALMNIADFVRPVQWPSMDQRIERLRRRSGLADVLKVVEG
jgi:hypothetical protein